MLPGSFVVGDEAVHADPVTYEAIQGEAPVWIVDPVDGTRQFVHGDPGFCTLVALAQGGVLLASVDTAGHPSLAWRAQHFAADAANATKDARLDATKAAQSVRADAARTAKSVRLDAAKAAKKAAKKARRVRADALKAAKAAKADALKAAHSATHQFSPGGFA